METPTYDTINRQLFQSNAVEGIFRFHHAFELADVKQDDAIRTGRVRQLLDYLLNLVCKDDCQGHRSAHP